MVSFHLSCSLYEVICYLQLYYMFFLWWSAIHVRVIDLCTVDRAQFLTEINEFSTISESFIKKKLHLFELNY